MDFLSQLSAAEDRSLGAEELYARERKKRLSRKSSTTPPRDNTTQKGRPGRRGGVGGGSRPPSRGAGSSSTSSTALPENSSSHSVSEASNSSRGTATLEGTIVDANQSVVDKDAIVVTRQERDLSVSPIKLVSVEDEVPTVVLVQDDRVAFETSGDPVRKVKYVFEHVTKHVGRMQMLTKKCESPDDDADTLGRSVETLGGRSLDMLGRSIDIPGVGKSSLDTIAHAGGEDVQHGFRKNSKSKEGNPTTTLTTNPNTATATIPLPAHQDSNARTSSHFYFLSEEDIFSKLLVGKATPDVSAAPSGAGSDAGSSSAASSSCGSPRNANSSNPNGSVNGTFNTNGVTAFGSPREPLPIDKSVVLIRSDKPLQSHTEQELPIPKNDDVGPGGGGHNDDVGSGSGLRHNHSQSKFKKTQCKKQEVFDTSFFYNLCLFNYLPNQIKDTLLERNVMALPEGRKFILHSEEVLPNHIYQFVLYRKTEKPNFMPGTDMSGTDMASITGTSLMSGRTEESTSTTSRKGETNASSSSVYMGWVWLFRNYEKFAKNKTKTQGYQNPEQYLKNNCPGWLQSYLAHPDPNPLKKLNALLVRLNTWWSERHLEMERILKEIKMKLVKFLVHEMQQMKERRERSQRSIEIAKQQVARAEEERERGKEKARLDSARGSTRNSNNPTPRKSTTLNGNTNENHQTSQQLELTREFDPAIAAARFRIRPKSREERDKLWIEARIREDRANSLGLFGRTVSRGTTRGGGKIGGVGPFRHSSTDRQSLDQHTNSQVSLSEVGNQKFDIHNPDDVIPANSPTRRCRVLSPLNPVDPVPRGLGSRGIPAGHSHGEPVDFDNVPDELDLNDPPHDNTPIKLQPVIGGTPIGLGYTSSSPRKKSYSQGQGGGNDSPDKGRSDRTRRGRSKSDFQSLQFKAEKEEEKYVEEERQKILQEEENRKIEEERTLLKILSANQGVSLAELEKTSPILQKRELPEDKLNVQDIAGDFARLQKKKSIRDSLTTGILNDEDVKGTLVGPAAKRVDQLFKNFRKFSEGMTSNYEKVKEEFDWKINYKKKANNGRGSSHFGGIHKDNYVGPRGNKQQQQQRVASQRRHSSFLPPIKRDQQLGDQARTQADIRFTDHMLDGPHRGRSHSDVGPGGSGVGGAETLEQNTDPQQNGGNTANTGMTPSPKKRDPELRRKPLTYSVSTSNSSPTRAGVGYQYSSGLGAVLGTASGYPTAAITLQNMNLQQEIQKQDEEMQNLRIEMSREKVIEYLGRLLQSKKYTGVVREFDINHVAELKIEPDIRGSTVELNGEWKWKTSVNPIGLNF